MNVNFDHSQPTADHITTFYFKPEKPVRYLAGQFTELRLPHPKTDDRGDKRWFTLSSSPTEQLLSITTKLADKPSSFKKVLFSLKPGTKLKLAEPMGDFVLPKDDSIPLLFVAGGIGITPMHSMIKYLLDKKEQRDITLLYSVATPGELAFRDLFEAYGLPATYLTQNPTPEWKDEVGPLTADRILEMPGARERRIYISGPEPMVEKFIEELGQQGVPADHLVGDYFPGYPAP